METCHGEILHPICALIFCTAHGLRGCGSKPCAAYIDRIFGHHWNAPTTHKMLLARQLTQVLTHSSCTVLSELHQFSSTAVLDSCFVANNQCASPHQYTKSRLPILSDQHLCVQYNALSSNQAVQ